MRSKGAPVDPSFSEHVTNLNTTSAVAAVIETHVVKERVRHVSIAQVA